MNHNEEDEDAQTIKKTKKKRMSNEQYSRRPKNLGRGRAAGA